MITETTIKKLSQSLNEPEWMLQKRLHSLKKFNQYETPVFKYGIGIFVDLSELDLENIDISKSKNQTTIKAPKEVEIINFTDSNGLIKNYFDETKEENKLTALQNSCFNEGKIIRIPENTILTEPILIETKMESTVIEHILVIAEKNSKATIIESASSLINNGIKSQQIKVIVKENAKLEYITVQNINNSIYNFSKRTAQVKQNGFLYWLDCNIGSKFTQHVTETTLEEEGAESKSWGVVFGDQNQCYDIKCDTIHSASKTTCDMLTRVVLNDKAKTIYRGLVKINPKAANCQGYQKDDTILLSDDAEADIVPNLEIMNNDVKCSHGATISQIDEEKLFYMMSRGIDKKAAKQAIVEGFFDPILVKIDNELLKEEILQSIAKRLQNLE